MSVIQIYQLHVYSDTGDWDLYLPSLCTKVIHIINVIGKYVYLILKTLLLFHP